MADVEVVGEREQPVDADERQQRRARVETSPCASPPRSAFAAVFPSHDDGPEREHADEHRRDRRFHREGVGKYHHEPVVANCPLRNAARSFANCTVSSEA